MISITVKLVNIGTDTFEQTEQTQFRLLLQEQSDHGLHCPFIESYRKDSKNWDTRNNYHNCPTIGTVGFYSAVLCSKDADRITNREDPDQTAP